MSSTFTYLCKRVLISLAVVGALASLVAPFFIHRTLYFYTDGADFRVETKEEQPPLRRCIWEPAVSLDERINQPGTDEYEPRLSPRGRFLVFTRGRPGSADLWWCERGVGGWGEPSPLVELNSPYDDMGACFGLSDDPEGLVVFFYSNRPGGEGGYDLWGSLRHEDGTWSSPWNLGPQVNSLFNEYSPSITADAQLLLFASNRRSGKDPEPPRWVATVRETYAVPDYDIYYATRLDVRAIDFGEGLRLEGLSLPDYSEGTVAIAPDGDCIYFASNRPEGRGGFDLYRAQLSGKVLGKPENLGPQVNTRGQELDPALSENGVELYFARQPESGRKNDIWVAVSREVFLQTGPGETYWSFGAVRTFFIRTLSIVDPTILALLLSFVFCFSFALLLSRRLSRSAILMRCVAIALLVHLLGALWMNTRKVHRVLLGTLGDRTVLGSFEVNLEGEAEDEIAFMIRNKVAVTGRDGAPSFDAGLPQVLAMEKEYDSTPGVAAFDVAPPAIESKPKASVAVRPVEELPGFDPIPPEPVTGEEVAPLVLEESTTLDVALALAHRGPSGSETLEREVSAVEFTSRKEGAMVPFEELKPLPVELSTEVEPEAVPAEVPGVESLEPFAEVIYHSLEPEAAGTVGLGAPRGPVVDVASPRKLQGAERGGGVRTAQLDLRMAPRLSLPRLQQESVLVVPVSGALPPRPSPRGSTREEPTPEDLASAARGASAPDVDRILELALPPVERDAGPEGTLRRREAAPEIHPEAVPQVAVFTRSRVKEPTVEVARPVPVGLLRAPSEENFSNEAGFQVEPARVVPMPVAVDREEVVEMAYLPPDGGVEAGEVLSPGNLVALRIFRSEQEPRVRPTPGADSLPGRRAVSVAIKRNKKLPSEDTPSLTVITHLEPARARAKGAQRSPISRSVAGISLQRDPVRSPEEALRPPPPSVNVTPRRLSAVERPPLVARGRGAPSLARRPGRVKETSRLPEEPRRLRRILKPVPLPSLVPSRPSPGGRSLSRLESVSAGPVSSGEALGERLDPLPVLLPMAPRVTVSSQAMRARLLPAARRGGPPRPLPPRARQVGLSPQMRPWVFPVAPLEPYLKSPPSAVVAWVEGEPMGAPEMRPVDPSHEVLVARVERKSEAGIPEPGSLKTVAAKSTFVPRIYELRSKTRRMEAVRLGGGSDETERAVERGLRWLALHQSPDGRWSLSDFTHHLPDSSPRDRWHPDWRGRGRYDSRGGSSRAFHGDTAATGLALLAFLGHGDTHVEPGPYRTNVSEGLRFLVSRQRRDGDLRGGGNLYMHAIATFAICEAYALTRSRELEEPARRAIDFTVRTQNPKRGGWRYKPYPQSKDVDTSVFGWMLMGIKSAHLAGIEVDESCVAGLVKYLDSVRMSADGGRYAYQPRLPRTSLAMVAQGLFCQQVLADLRPPRTARERLLQRRAANESVSIVLGNRPRPQDQDGTNFYYWYYAGLAIFQEEGAAWSTWNAQMKPVLLDLQLKEETGTAAGSWDPLSRQAKLGGRVYSTALSILCLEVYYRYAPRGG